jgi:hypothetical protein
MRQNKQERFVEEFLIDLNATQAAIRAGYSEKTAKSQGQRLLTNVDIAAAFARAQGRKGARAQGRKGARAQGRKGARAPDGTHQHHARLCAGRHFRSYGTLQAS